MLEINHKLCNACRACKEICPVNAIEMREEEDTFFYPCINKEKCIKCNKCDEVCPIGYEKFFDSNNIQAKVGRHKEDNVIYKSSSGGAFTALFQLFMRRNAIVYGVKFDNNHKVLLDYAIDKEGCEEFRKSKYIQADTNGCFEKINQQLKSRQILFSGTPCQVAALNNYLSVKKRSTDNLTTVAILCHGVVSQKLFDIYISEMERHEKSRIERYQFRCKDTIPVNSRLSSVVLKNKKIKILGRSDDPYLRGFYQRLFYRESCYSCEFARPDRVADITIFDAWNIDQIDKNYNPDFGTSVLMSATEKGDVVIDQIDEFMNLKTVSKEWALDSQKILKQPSKLNPKRELFFLLLYQNGFHKAVFDCIKKSKKEQLFSLLPQIIKNRIRKIRRG